MAMLSVLTGGKLPTFKRTTRRSARRKVLLSRLAPMFTVLTLSTLALTAAVTHFSHEAPLERVSSRRSLYEYEEGVCDSYLTTHYTYLAVALLAWGIFYMFWGLAIVCDDYFVTSLEDISESLNLSPDVAGATFMAAGSSAPELFTSLMGIFAVKNDVGIGTIVGSAVFNLCCIIGGTALFTPITLTIDWKPITRDSFFYAISIGAMIQVLRDGAVTLIESLVLVIFYVLYVVFMYYNPQFMSCLSRIAGENVAQKLEDEEEKKEEARDDDDDDEETPIAKAIAKPLEIALLATIPDCSKPHNKNRYLLTFMMSIVWIGVLSYFMVTWASKLGCLWHVHPAIMGVTVLAAGTSVPDAIGSLLVARDGQGDMAVSNAIGSNVFDILLGLGLPWSLSCIAYGIPVAVDAENLEPMSIILFSTLAAVYGVTIFSGFKLTKCVGAIFFSFYFLFVAYNLMHEFGHISF
ncbi:hypothetical protein AB1Y20_018380 [Prymnesium parvum]|uniref:Sodium/calcium exchanger membrane region domain-containing protein n=1 Tax=Prymnesium parvum TaxID=97485 RepID=A0AB34JN83_PRYPA